MADVRTCWSCGFGSARLVSYATVEVRLTGERRRVPLCKRCLTSPDHQTSWRPMPPRQRRMLEPPEPVAREQR